jgi:hypothetical protein
MRLCCFAPAVQSVGRRSLAIKLLEEEHSAAQQVQPILPCHHIKFLSAAVFLLHKRIPRSLHCRSTPAALCNAAVPLLALPCSLLVAAA